VTPLTDPRAKRHRGLPHLSQVALDHLLLLPLGAAIALLWANIQAESYYNFTYAAAFAVNNVAMVFFFALMTKEVVEATAPGGVLHTRRRAWLPIVAAIGATAVPAFLYLRTVDLLDEPMLNIAWPVSLGTDVAISYLVAKIVFRRHPALPFLLLVAIASDVLGFLALAWVNPASELHPLTGAGLLALAIGVAYALRRARVKSFWPYLTVAGSISWYAMFRGGLAPALALVPIVPFLPHAARDPGFLVDAPEGARDALNQFELWFRYPFHLTLFFFGLVNAGVPLRTLEPGTWGLPLAVITGRPIGLLVGAAVAAVFGLRLPDKVGWRELIVVGLAAAVGFTVSLFICAELLPAGQLRSELGMGVLLSLIAGPLAIVAARVLGVGRFAAEP
jgi:NhaA family Na+:H+ antiporter